MSVRVTIVVGSLRCGGAERYAILLAEELRKRGYRVTLLVGHLDAENNFFPVPEDIQCISFEPEAFMECRWFDLPRQIARSQAVRRSVLSTSPDVIVGFTEVINLKLLSAMRSESIPIVAVERTDLRFYKINFRLQLLRRMLYPRAATVVVQTNDLMRWILKKNYRWKLEVIPNFISSDVLSRDESSRVFEFQPGLKYITALGRLEPEKRFDLLIRCFSQLTEKHPNWRLIVIGNGSLRAALEETIANLNMRDCVVLTGEIRPPYETLRRSDLFVLTSQFEGFPNCLLEAMALGVASISFRCHSGPDEIIRDSVDGVLVPNGDEAALVDAMDRLMEDDDCRHQLAIRGKETLERFAPSRIIDRWESVIRSALAP